MIRFERIFDTSTASERRRLADVQALFRRLFPTVAGYSDYLPSLLAHHEGFEVILLTAEDAEDHLMAFVFVHYYPAIRYAYLDYIGSDPDQREHGVGGAIYEAIRELLARKGAKGLFMDVPPDEPTMVRDPARLPINQQRLKFYEQYGAFPIIGTAYEEPVQGQDYDSPFLVYDPLGRSTPLSRGDAGMAVREILHRKYGWSPQDPRVMRILTSFRDNPVKLRPPRYTPPESSPPPHHNRLYPLKMVVAAHHEVHHVRERGYVERPVRVESILRGLNGLPVERRPPRNHGEEAINAVHDPDYVSYLARVCLELEPGQTVYPYIFPIRHSDRKPRDKALQAGYYCMDTFTPLSVQAYQAARAAVDCALTAADLLMQGQQLVYALCRPPGHHAERKIYGGFCYFNNAAIAAHALSTRGKVAVLDIDFHHGNGSQDIFYHRDDVLVISIHGDPDYAYPYFSGFEDERGEGVGLGYNVNFPLQEGIDDLGYLEVLNRALTKIKEFKPICLVVSLGLDIMRGDPTGSFVLTTQGVRRIGKAIGQLHIPTLIVQEGGYALRNLARGANAFFTEMLRAWY